jgi:hypothetical protein
MKAIFPFSAIVICVGLFTSCNKDQVPDPVLTPKDLAVQKLTGMGNRYWHLTDLYINNVQQVLTSAQKKYTKTYTLTPGEDDTGTFTNADGYKGNWDCPDPSLLNETIVTINGQRVRLNYTILELTNNKLDITYVSNNQQIREVYVAF